MDRFATEAPQLRNVPSLLQWFEVQGLKDVTPITKDSPETRAWFASTSGSASTPKSPSPSGRAASGRDFFLKLYPHQFVEPRAAIEIAIAGANLHPAIIPLLQVVPCQEGSLLVYDRVAGESLGPMEMRGRFQALPLEERIPAVTSVCDALTAISEAGFMIVDWYEGNMIYDFSQKQMWLFDWELCRKGEGFTLDMDANYGSSRLMAPEEFIRGSWLDQQTLVFIWVAMLCSRCRNWLTRWLPYCPVRPIRPVPDAIGRCGSSLKP